MASEKNLNAVFTDIANAIREKKGTTDQIKPINMAEEIVNLPSGGGGSLKTLLDATKSCYWLFNRYKGTSVDGLISYSDTANVTNMESMFAVCENIKTIPQLDTSNVTTMKQMFGNCKEITEIPELDTSKVTDMSSMFSYCYNIKTIPQFDTSRVTNMGGMFEQCLRLETIPSIDVSNVQVLGNYMFTRCMELKTILMYGMKVSFNISSSTKFEESDLVTILNNLATVTSTQTLTMGSTNLAKLTDEEKAIATSRGWTLA